MKLYLQLAILSLLLYACSSNTQCIDFKQVTKLCDYCDSNINVYKNDSLTLYKNAQYGVIIKPIKDGWEDYFITDKVTQSANTASINFEDILFAIREYENPTFLGLYDHFLLFDDSTSSSSGTIVITDLKEQKLVKTLSTNGFPLRLKAPLIYYWTASEDTNKKCPQYHDTVEENVFNLNTLKVEKTGQRDCHYSE